MADLPGVADLPDIVLRLHEVERAHERHIEDQRATMTNLILLVSSAALGYLSHGGLGHGALIVTVPLIVLGVYGAVASAKFYERFRFHSVRAAALRELLDELVPDLERRERMDQARAVHERQHKLVARLRLHLIWRTFHLFVALSGVILTIVALTR